MDMARGRFTTAPCRHHGTAPTDPFPGGDGTRERIKKTELLRRRSFVGLLLDELARCG